MVKEDTAAQNTALPQILIGTSGYDYPEWKSVFYPPELKRADFLPYYSTQFNAVELNSTFYNMPTADRLLSFYDRSQGKLNFSIKANRLLTHEIAPSWDAHAADFKLALLPLLEKDKLCSVLFQFPQSFHYTNDNRIYLAKVIEAFENFPVVIEFRHKEWIRPSVFEGLIQRNASVAFCDMPELPSLPSSNFHSDLYSTLVGLSLYIRLHGRNAQAWYASSPSLAEPAHALATPQNNASARYTYNYSPSELQKFVPIIQSTAASNRKVQVYFNNHPQGNGAVNAMELMKMIERLFSKHVEVKK